MSTFRSTMRAGNTAVCSRCESTALGDGGAPARHEIMAEVKRTIGRTRTIELAQDRLICRPERYILVVHLRNSCPVERRYHQRSEVFVRSPKLLGHLRVGSVIPKYLQEGQEHLGFCTAGYFFQSTQQRDLNGRKRAGDHMRKNIAHNALFVATTMV